jgi:hypothetical protein
MNRRQFTQRLAALATTPALPAGMIGSAVSAGATRPLHQFQHPYSWAAFISRIHDKASPQMFKRHLALDDETAKRVFDTLVRENVISAPNAMGLSHAMNPFKRSFGASIGASPQTAFKARVEDTVDKAKDALDEFLEETDTPALDSEPVNLDSSKYEDEPDTCENFQQCPSEISS